MICLPSLISWNQYDFLHGRRIVNNILLGREVVKDYHKPIAKPRCAIKIDIKKAFDSVHWDFILNTLIAMGFPSLFIH